MNDNVYGAVIMTQSLREFTRFMFVVCCLNVCCVDECDIPEYRVALQCCTATNERLLNTCQWEADPTYLH